MIHLCGTLKAKGIGPVLVLTSRDKLQDELHALDLGADDYLNKPCHKEVACSYSKSLEKI